MYMSTDYVQRAAIRPSAHSKKSCTLAAPQQQDQHMNAYRTCI